MFGCDQRAPVMQPKIVSLHKRWTRMHFSIISTKTLKTPILTHYLNVINVWQINNTVHWSLCFRLVEFIKQLFLKVQNVKPYLFFKEWFLFQWVECHHDFNLHKIEFCFSFCKCTPILEHSRLKPENIYKGMI